MRILFWSETFWPRVGGVENLAARLLPVLVSRGFEFIVVTWENIPAADELSYDGIPVYRFPFFSGGRRGSLELLLENRRQVATLKKDFAPDLVHVNSYGQSVLFHVDTASLCPVPVLVTLHQALPYEPIERESLLGSLLRTSDWITACSASVLAHTRRLLPEITPRSSVIYNGLMAPAFEPQPISFEPPRLLCLGRLVAGKGFALAMTAFAKIRQRFPSARLLIAGDGPERDHLQQQAIESGLIDSVEFAGSIPPEKVPHFIGASTLVLIPSRMEGFGLVALEAALMARPVVATRVGGLSEVVAHEETGLLVETNDSDGIAAAVERLLEYPELAARMGQAARRRAQKRFGWDRYVDAYDALYQKVVADWREKNSGRTAQRFA